MPSGKTNYGSPFVFIVLMAVFVIASAWGLLSQWEESVRLRMERELAQWETREAERLRAANARLRARQISPAELQSLRADHAALPRLRAELDALARAPAP